MIYLKISTINYKYISYPSYLKFIKFIHKIPKLKASSPILAELGMKSIVKIKTICKKTREDQTIFLHKLVLIRVSPPKYRICLTYTSPLDCHIIY